jgi:hypothetical protein
VARDLDKEERRVGRSGNDLGVGSRGCDAGSTSDYVRRIFASLSLAIFGKTEVTRDLD